MIDSILLGGWFVLKSVIIFAALYSFVFYILRTNFVGFMYSKGLYFIGHLNFIYSYYFNFKKWFKSLVYYRD